MPQRPYTVESGVPIPGSPRTGCYKYPFDRMAVGDSFSLKGAPDGPVRSAASYYGKRNGKRFSVYRDDGTHRCWRIS